MGKTVQDQFLLIVKDTQNEKLKYVDKILPVSFWQTLCSRGCPTNSLVINSLSNSSFS